MAGGLLYANSPRSCQCSFNRPHGRVASARKTLSCEPCEVLSLSPNVVTSRRACRADWCPRAAVDTTSTGSALSRTELVRGISGDPAPEVIWLRSGRLNPKPSPTQPQLPCPASRIPIRTAEIPKRRNASKLARAVMSIPNEALQKARTLGGRLVKWIPN